MTKSVMPYIKGYSTSNLMTIIYIYIPKTLYSLDSVSIMDSLIVITNPC